MLGPCPAVISPVLFSFETMTLERVAVSSFGVVLVASSSSLVQITSIVPRKSKSQRGVINLQAIFVPFTR
jgi:hypothetical protein